MKFTMLLGAVAAIASHATAFHGWMDASDYYTINGVTYQDIWLTDSTTGNTYVGELVDGFNGCVNSKCPIYFREAIDGGGYNFHADLWRTNDGCHNIDFNGALDAHHGYSCGKLPRQFKA